MGLLWRVPQVGWLPVTDSASPPHCGPPLGTAGVDASMCIHRCGPFVAAFDRFCAASRERDCRGHDCRD